MCAELAAAARKRGGFLALDGYIAAIAVSRGFMVATRDTESFEAVGAATLILGRQHSPA